MKRVIRNRIRGSAMVCLGSLFVSSVAFAAAPVAIDRTLGTDEDAPLNITLTGEDAGTGAEISVDSAVIVADPIYGSITTSGSDTTMIVYKPTDDCNGSGVDSFEYKVTLAGQTSTNTGTITINIASVKDPPEINPVELTVPEDTPTTFDFSLYVADKDDGTDACQLATQPRDAPQKDSLTYLISAPPSHGSFNTMMGKNVVYTPNNNYTGTDQFKLRVTDHDGESHERTFTIRVGASNDPPVAMDQMISIQEDMETVIRLIGEDPENSTLDYTITQQPTKGMLSGMGQNVTYRPNADFAGMDQFKFKVTDPEGADSNVATVTITVGEANDPPFFTGTTPGEGDMLVIDEGGTLEFQAVAMDADGDTPVFGLDGLAQLKGANFDAATGEFSWTTDYTHVGEYDVALNVTDNKSDPIERNLRITVNRLDTDGDNLSDTFEEEIGTDPTKKDTDGDTISDRDEIDIVNLQAVDTNGNGVIDALEADSDGDGIPDRDEAGDTDLATVPPDFDGDLKPNFQDDDSDNDGIKDGEDNCVLYLNADQSNIDGDPLGDACDDDTDGDGVPNATDSCPLVNGEGDPSGCVPREEEPEEEGLCSKSSVAGDSPAPGGLTLLVMMALGLFGWRRRR